MQLLRVLQFGKTRGEFFFLAGFKLRLFDLLQLESIDVDPLQAFLFGKRFGILLLQKIFPHVIKRDDGPAFFFKPGKPVQELQLNGRLQDLLMLVLSVHIHKK